jgi:EAL and modified HD-GYP domain-containing signal transduction protein
MANIRPSSTIVQDPNAGLGRAASSHAAHAQSYLARQPILDQHRHLFAYELFFRGSRSAESCAGSSDDASARVIVDAVLAIGLDTLTSGKRAFVNVTREILLSGAAALLPANQVVIELIEDIEADAQVVAACEALKRSGHAIALDDFVYNQRTADLVRFADYVKVDFLLMKTPSDRAAVVEAARAAHARLLAEKIETLEQFDEAVREGFMYFQGYFFGRPAIREAKHIPTQKLGYAALVVKVNDPSISVGALEDLIKHDASLTYRVLRAVNSAASALHTEMRSIRQAIVLLGRDTIRRWASLWALAGLGDSRHTDLVATSIIRARCCELLDASGSADTGNGFLLGICSLLDAILDQPMDTVLAQLPLDNEVRAALQGQPNGRRTLLDCVIAYERGEWDRCEQLAQQAGLDASVLPIAYQEALKWTRDLSSPPA